MFVSSFTIGHFKKWDADYVKKLKFEKKCPVMKLVHDYR
jgi:hypothetical protein